MKILVRHDMSSAEPEGMEQRLPVSRSTHTGAALDITQCIRFVWNFPFKGGCLRKTTDFHI